MSTRHLLGLAVVVGTFGCGTVASADDVPTVEEADAALRKAVTFFAETVATHGGYVWRTSGDLTLREGEATVGPDTIWVQPPATPAVGDALLDAYNATGDPAILEAAHAAGRALALGQLQSGGWDYRIEFEPEARKTYRYRLNLDGTPASKPVPPADNPEQIGWHAWKTRKNKGNVSTFDDNTTQAATRFLARLDRALNGQDHVIHEAASIALIAIFDAQYPNGGWSHNFDRLPARPPSESKYPKVPASYPDAWSRTWPKDFDGTYVTNDNLVADMIDTLLTAHEVYGNTRNAKYLDAARRAGDFLILAQMPEPQPAWAQQYDATMHPTWARKFEPPAISGGESQNIMLALIQLYHATGDTKYLEPIPKAIVYLRRSELPDRRLARFYELKTNRPLYFTKDYQITYSPDDMPTHYSFIVDSRLDAIEREYQAAVQGKPAKRPNSGEPGVARTRAAIESLDDRGAWIEKTRMRGHKVEPESGVLESATFIKNVNILSRYIQAKSAKK